MVLQKVICKTMGDFVFFICASRLGVVKNVHQGAINFHELFF